MRKSAQIRARGGRSPPQGVLRPGVLRLTDPETARVVAVHGVDGQVVGAGCLIDQSRIVTCRRVAESALRPGRLAKDAAVRITSLGIKGQPSLECILTAWGARGPQNDLAMLQIGAGPVLQIPAARFASPLRHAGKPFSMTGFPAADLRGRNVAGLLRAEDGRGLVELHGDGAAAASGGFSGAPLWCRDVGAFVGIAVLGQPDDALAWCIPSRRLAEFAGDLPVRFRVPAGDRPAPGAGDDPNAGLFGEVSNDGDRQLLAAVHHRRGKRHYEVSLRYQCLPGSAAPRGRFVTFITHPDGPGGSDRAAECHHDYEMFAELRRGEDESVWYAEQRFQCGRLFTIAAVGDAGDTALTLDLEAQYARS